MIRLETQDSTVRLFLDQVEILRHSPSKPLLEIGRADFHYKSTDGGLHRIKNLVTGWIALRGCEVHEQSLRFFKGEISVEIKFVSDGDGFSFFLHLPQGFDYARLNLPADSDEAIYGGGVQFNHLNLRGRRFPLWTSEMGLGRHPFRPYTWLANLIADAGGAYWNTYFPQSSFLSTRGYACLVETGGFSVLDFSRSNLHRIEVLGEAQFRFQSGENLKELLGKQSRQLGIMPAPPDWVFEGGILGIQGGLPDVSQTVDRVLAAGAKLSGIWTQDWAGVRIFWQGKRIFWNWIVNEELYPDMRAEIRRRSEQGIRWLAYVNPYFNPEGELFKVANRNGFLIKDALGETLIKKIAGFQVGSIDLTNPGAVAWYKDTIIRRNMLDLGMRGWMADYAEDVPEEAVFFDGRKGKDLHNLYPLLWAKLNREAVEEAGLQDEVLVFHRSGYTGATRYMNSQWGGDQVVYWDRHDGFPAAITGGLSGCMSGLQYYHTDAGGYFSFRWIKRTKELLLRWCEANTFSPILRTHEGNRPWAGVQPWQDEETLAHFARFSRIHAALAPYLKYVSLQAQRTGLGMLRPFCLSHPEPRWANKMDAYYLGDDLIVYPVMHPSTSWMRVEIPEGCWISLFGGKDYGPGGFMVECPVGKPAVFHRAGSEFEEVFQEAAKI